MTQVIRATHIKILPLPTAECHHRLLDLNGRRQRSTTDVCTLCTTARQRLRCITFCCCTVSKSSLKLMAAARVIPKLFFPHEVRLALLNSFGRTLFRAGGGALATAPPSRRARMSTTIIVVSPPAPRDVLPRARGNYPQGQQ